MKFLFVLAVFVALGFAHPTSIKEDELPTTQAREIFRANFAASSLSAAFGGFGVSYGNQNVGLWESGGGMDVRYPAGSYKPSASPVGGFGIWTKHRITTIATLRYGIQFPVGFNFVKGGKLPGLYGGKTGCTGGDPANDCFSTRLMWREQGKGELYLYANRPAQDPAICLNPANYCNPHFGWSLNKGAWTFQTGRWYQMDVVVKLNDPGVRNGVLAVKVDGQDVIRYTNIVFRTAQYPNIVVDGMDIETFFGGGDPTWATPTHQIVKFRDFVLLVD